MFYLSLQATRPVLKMLIQNRTIHRSIHAERDSRIKTVIGKTCQVNTKCMHEEAIPVLHRSGKR